MYELKDIKELALFKIDEALFGINIDHIQEINKNLKFTRVFNAAGYVKGVMNLRGQIVTVIDLRVKLNYTKNEMRQGNRVVIVKHKSESVGLLVDKMEDIIEVEPERIENSSAKIAGVNPEYFAGIYKLDDGLVIILDVDQLLFEDESSAAVA